MAKVDLENVFKVYDGGVRAVNEFNLNIKDKEFIVFVGPSGCGKSTTLRMIAGLENITQGGLYIDDKLVNDVDSKNRDIAMVFQNYALYPHMTVYQNMAFGLKLRHTPKAEIDARVKKAAEILEISELFRAVHGVRDLPGSEEQRGFCERVRQDMEQRRFDAEVCRKAESHINGSKVCIYFIFNLNF